MIKQIFRDFRTFSEISFIESSAEPYSFWAVILHPVRNNAPLLPPGQAPPRKGSCPGGRPSGPAAATGLDFRIIPARFNTLLGFESQRLEFLTGFTRR